MLAVGYGDLPQIRAEFELLAGLFGDRLTVIADADATPDAVLAALPGHDHVHFSCHGRQYPSDPSRGELLLHGGGLTIPRIGASAFQGEFAFLSACMTGLGGTALMEEALTLNASMHFAGVRHTIGTMWVVDADVAAELSTSVYQGLTADGRFDPSRSAAVLARVTREFRDRWPDQPSQWANFVHTGP